MILIDAGPLIAIVDRDDRDHDRCVSVLRRLAVPLVTTWPALTEAMYLLGDRAGWAAQERLWRMLLRRDLIARVTDQPTLARAFDLMRTYRNVPMDFADATLVALAESLDDRRVFTLDRDFTIYRLHGRTRFELLPGSMQPGRQPSFDARSARR